MSTGNIDTSSMEVERSTKTVRATISDPVLIEALEEYKYQEDVSENEIAKEAILTYLESKIN